MSEAKKQYEKVMTANDEYISMSIDNRKIRAYVSELEQEKAELVDDSKKMYYLLNLIAHRKGTKMVDAKQIRDVLRNIKQYA